MELSDLNALEQQLISLRIPFMKMVATSATLKIQTKAGFLLDLHAKNETLFEIAQLPLDKLCDISLLNAPEFTAIHDSTNIIEIFGNFVQSHFLFTMYFFSNPNLV